MAEVGEHALTCEPMRGGGDEYLMLVIADEPPAAEHRQRPRDDKAARAAAEFDDDRRAQCLDRVDDMRQEAGVGFPTAEMRQRIFGKVEAAQQRGLLGLSPAPQPPQQPRPLDGAKGDAPGCASWRERVSQYR